VFLNFFNRGECMRCFSFQKLPAVALDSGMDSCPRSGRGQALRRNDALVSSSSRKRGSIFYGLGILALSAVLSVAHAQHSDKEIKEDIQRHRAMAAAHEAAAKCLESGQKPDACTKQLQAACKGLAVGKYCGMKHAH
jgi:hypothetical protein